jgi:long-chain fatty acid transport protein
MKKIIALSVFTSSLMVAGGYKLPEQSLNSMALGTAYVAHTTAADAAYFNPANMAFMGDKQYIESSLTFIHLPQNKFISTANTIYNGQSERENILAPNMHYVSTPKNHWRWGMSIVTPGGLTKRWKTPYQKLYAEEFTLKIVELNPVLSYQINSHFSIGGGVRIVYSQGIVKSDGNDAGIAIRRDMKGDTIAFGYNIAMSYRPAKDINLALTYRSNINLKEKGQANLYLGGVGQQYNANVTVPLPATLSLAISKSWKDMMTLEFVYERTFWSTYKTLDFQYDRPIQSSLVPVFDNPVTRDWKNSNTFRLGATMNFTQKLTGMLGFSIDKTPVPTKTIGFELPDSDGTIFSAGLRYQYAKDISFGLAFLYDRKKSLSLTAGQQDNSILNQGGRFSGGGAYLTTLGMSYEF